MPDVAFDTAVRVRSLDLDGVADGGIAAACMRQVSGDAGARGHGLELDLATDAPLGSGLGARSVLAGRDHRGLRVLGRA